MSATGGTDLASGDGIAAVPDVRRPSIPAALPVRASDDDAAVLARIGRCEDLAVSPSGDRLALIGFHSDRLTLVDVALVEGAEGTAVELRGARSSTVRGLRAPHGVTFVDDDHLVTANRDGAVTLIELGADGASSTRTLVDEFHPVPVAVPGSLEVLAVTDSLVEVYVCNNHSHTVNRYLVDRDAGWSVIDAQVLLASELAVPDGVAISPAADWIAISSHERHAVNLYRLDEHLGPSTPPHVVLDLGEEGYPHGLAFVGGGTGLVVADAGGPRVLGFASDPGGWGASEPSVRSTRVMTDAAFARGRYSEREGGPKGVAVLDDGVVVVSSEHQPLVFLDLAAVWTAGAAPHPDGRRVDVVGRVIRSMGSRVADLESAERSPFHLARWRARSALRRVKVAARRTRRRDQSRPRSRL